ncbi:MAG: hypothetical protein ACREFC_08485 [Stellaceae bacterium]
MTLGMVDIGLDWRGMARNVSCLDWRSVARGLPRGAFIAGLGLSAIAAVVLLLAAYFAGTAPRLPGSADALETLKTGGAWPPSVTARALDTRVAPTRAAASPHDMHLLPRSSDPSQAPPIDIKDLPPVEHHFR